MLIAGVDDAGRGSTVGPLVIAGVLLAKKNLPRLTRLGVRDSKQLSPSKRERLAEEIKKIALKHHVIKLSPAQIDKVVETGKRLHKLNWLEAQTMARVISALQPDAAYVDAADVLADRFGMDIVENLEFKVQIISEHKADVTYPIVSAASIIAKVERDQAISELRDTYGDFGCGYATDPKTLQFLENLVGELGSYPDFVRKSWKTAKRLKEKVKQAKLV